MVAIITTSVTTTSVTTTGIGMVARTITSTTLLACIFPITTTELL